MEFKLHYSPKFLEDLLTIGDYIELQLFNPSGAERITNGIMDATNILAKYPESGARIFLPGGLDSGYRFVVFEDYLAVYRIRPDEVCIVRAVNVKQDFMRELFPWMKRTGEKNA